MFSKLKDFLLDLFHRHPQKRITLSNGNIIEVDKKLSEIIKILNDKGYETAFSCQGRKNQPLYIAFKKQYLEIIESYPRDIFYHVTVNSPVYSKYYSLSLICKKDSNEFVYEDVLSWVRNLKHFELGGKR